MFRYLLVISLIACLSVPAWSEDAPADPIVLTQDSLPTPVPTPEPTPEPTRVTLDTIHPETPLLSPQDRIAKGRLLVQIRQLRNNQGNLKVSLFNQPDGFPRGGKMAYRNQIIPLSQNQADVAFTELPFGTYAVSIWHDENKDDKMQTNWLGIPTEGLGTSRDAKGPLGPPKYKDATIEFNQEEMIIVINTYYL